MRHEHDRVNAAWLGALYERRAMGNDITLYAGMHDCEMAQKVGQVFLMQFENGHCPFCGARMELEPLLNLEEDGTWTETDSDGNVSRYIPTTGGGIHAHSQEKNSE